MTSKSVIVLSTCNKTSNEINNFFGVDNVLSIKNSKKESLKKKTTESNSFLKLFKPTVESYSDKSFILKPTKNKSKVKSYLVVDESPFVKPLYWNKTLGGWITSKDNGKVLKAPSQSKPQKCASKKCASKKCTPKKCASKKDSSNFMEMFSPSVVSHTQRSLLVTPTKNKNKVKNYHIVDESPFVKPLYWCKTLGGCITSKDNELVLGELECPDEEDVTEEDVVQTLFDKFMKLTKPTVEEYSPRSLLIKPTKNISSWVHNYPKVDGFPLKKPLYWNKSLGGWITSKDNKNIIDDFSKSKINIDYSYLTTITAQDEKELSDFVLHKYKRGLLLKRTTEEDVESPEKYFHNGFWNGTLNGWVYSNKEKKNLVSKGAVFA